MPEIKATKAERRDFLVKRLFAELDAIETAKTTGDVHLKVSVFDGNLDTGCEVVTRKSHRLPKVTAT